MNKDAGAAEPCGASCRLVVPSPHVSRETSNPRNEPSPPVCDVLAPGEEGILPRGVQRGFNDEEGEAQ